MFIQRNGYPVPTSASGDTRIHFPTLYGASQSVSKVRIIATLFAVRTVIFNLQAYSGEMCTDHRFKPVSCVITSQSYFHLVVMLIYRHAVLVYQP